VFERCDDKHVSTLTSYPVQCRPRVRGVCTGPSSARWYRFADGRPGPSLCVPMSDHSDDLG
jgi:hypothetical protein